MKIGLMLLAILPMLIVSGVDGFSFGVNNGKESYSNHIDANKGVDISGHFSLNGEHLAGNCEFKGNGALSVSETRSDSKKDSVTLSAKGFLLSGDYYKPKWDVNGNCITGIQGLKATGNNFELTSEAVNRNGLDASVSAGVGKGSINLNQGATASEFMADSWQKIASASGDNIELKADILDGSGKNRADSIVTIDQDGSLTNFNSEARGDNIAQSKDVDLYAIHGPVVVGDDQKNPAGSISGDTIVSKGLTTNQKGLSADYSVTINHGTVGGIYDWGTETKSTGFVIAVPLESPEAWGGFSDSSISISGQCHNKAASEIESNSEAYIVDSKGKKIVISEDRPKAQYGVSVTNWDAGHGFAKSSQAGNP